MDKCNALLDTLQNDPSVETSMASLWMQSWLAAFAGRSREGARLLAQAADTASSSETIYALIMDSYQGRERQQRTLSWLPPGCHELDILWQSYFKKLEGTPAHSTPASLLKLAQSSDWRVTSYAMGEAWRLLEKQRKMPPGVQLATRLCLAGKNVGEGHDEIAFTALNALEADARKAKDNAVLSRVGNQLLTLTGRYKMEPERLIALCGLFEEVNAHENVRGTATLRVAKAYERKRDFEKARLWLDKVPTGVLSPQGRQTLLDRWKALEEVLEKRKNASNTTK